MAYICCVEGCKRSVQKGSDGEGLKLYRFPRDESLFYRWKETLKIVNPKSCDRVCSLHFADSDYMLTNLGWHVLIPGAVPSLFLPSSNGCSTSEKSSNIPIKKENDLDQTLVLLDTSRESNSSSDGPLSCNSDFRDEIDHNSSEVFEREQALFNCMYCPSTFDNRLMLLMHISNHFKQHSCQKCQRIFYNQEAFSKHIRSCTVNSAPLPLHSTKFDSQFICKLCGYTSDFSSDLRSHHHPVQPQLSSLSCLLCNINFSSTKTLKTHVTYKHLNDTCFCDTCARLFHSKLEFGLHGQRHGYPNECPECCELFKTSAALESHLKCHKDMIFFACNFCSLLFSSVEIVRSHLKVHLLQDPIIKCNFCRDYPVNLASSMYHVHKFSVSSDTLEINTECRGIEMGSVRKTSDKAESSKTFHRESDLKVVSKCQLPKGFDVKEEVPAPVCNTDIRIVEESQSFRAASTFKNQLQCLDCDTILMNEYEMAQHQDLHKNRGDFSCIECGIQCHTSIALTAHYEDHVKKESDGDWSSDDDT